MGVTKISMDHIDHIHQVGRTNKRRVYTDSAKIHIGQSHFGQKNIFRPNRKSISAKKRVYIGQTESPYGPKALVVSAKYNVTPLIAVSTTNHSTCTTDATRTSRISHCNTLNESEFFLRHLYRKSIHIC